MPRLACTRCEKSFDLEGAAQASTPCPACGGTLHDHREAAVRPGTALSDLRESDIAATLKAPPPPAALRASDIAATLRAPASPDNGVTLKAGAVRPSAPPDLGATLKAAPGQGPSGRASGAAETIPGAPSALSRAPSESLPRKSSLNQGTAFGRYNLLVSLGSGGMGIVWKAWDNELRRMVALKQIKHQDNTDPEVVSRFLREARLAAKLRHPNIVGVHDVGKEEGRDYITMDFVDGVTFSAFLEQTQELKRQGSRKGMERLRHEVRLLADVAAAIAYAHREGIIHRDLKPSNVLVDREDRPFVMDFGLAKEVGGTDASDSKRVAMTHMTLGGQLLGTPAYMSPEQAAGDSAKIGPRTDVWALGVMLYEILTGRLPFEGKNTWELLSAASQGDVLPPKRKYRHAPEELEAICLKALEKDPARRYETAAELAEEMMRWLRGDPVLAKKPTLAYYAWRWISRRKARVISSLVAAAMLAAALSWAWRERAIGHEHARSMLEESVVAVTRFEDQLLRTVLNPDARVVMAKLPLNLLDRMVQDDANFGPAYAWRGQVKHLLGRDAEAETDFDEACKRTPEDGEVWYVRGLYRLDKYERAMGLPDFARTPKGAEVAVERTPTAEEKGWRDAAVADLERMSHAEVLRDNFKARELRLGQAAAALWSGRPDGPKEAVALVAGIAGPRAAKIRGFVHYRQGRFEEAVFDFWETLGNWPQDERTWRHSWMAREAAWCVRQADAAGARERIAKAREGFDATVRALEEARTKELQQTKEAGSDRLPRDRSELVHGYVDRGCAALLLAEMDADAGKDPRPLTTPAIADFSQALEIWRGDKRNAEMTVAYVNRARAEILAGSFDVGDGTVLKNAYADLSAALSGERNPDLGEAFDLRGRAAMLFGDAMAAAKQDPREYYKKAEADLKAALEKRYPPAYLTLGNFLAARNRYDEAIAAFEAGAKAVPTRADGVKTRIAEVREAIAKEHK